MSDTQEFSLVPNFTQLVTMFLRDAKLNAQLMAHSPDPVVISTFRNFLVALNIACLSVHDNETLMFFRQEVEAMTELLVKVDDGQKNSVMFLEEK